MRQRITKDQLLSLSEDQRKKLREWWKPEVGDHYIHWNDEFPDAFDENYVGDYLEKEAGYAYYDSERYPEEHACPLLSIGQMIEFLDERERLGIYGELLLNGQMVRVRSRWLEYPPGQLCDTLWQAVKEILEKEDSAPHHNP
jgi:hypothetical protein